MNRNAETILALCSHLCVGDGVVPLETKEWGNLAANLRKNDWQPCDLFDLDDRELMERLPCDAAYTARLRRLLDRSASLTFELNQYRNIGILPVTRADAEYPPALKRRLKNNCPPLFYCAGDLSLLKRRCVGYVGSRDIGEADINFTRATVEKTVRAGYAVASGGARGVDTVSAQTALEFGAPAVEFVADSMMRKLRKSDVVRAVRDGRLLILSAVNPDAGFQVGTAMMRNRYIYANSEAAVVVRSDLKEGGTWAGATDNLRHGWCQTLCWNKKSYRGNQALIELGAVAIDENWDGNLTALPPPLPPPPEEEEAPVQQSLFGI